MFPPEVWKLLLQHLPPTIHIVLRQLSLACYHHAELDKLYLKVKRLAVIHCLDDSSPWVSFEFKEFFHQDVFDDERIIYYSIGCGYFRDLYFDIPISLQVLHDENMSAPDHLDLEMIIHKAEEYLTNLGYNSTSFHKEMNKLVAKHFESCIQDNSFFTLKDILTKWGSYLEPYDKFIEDALSDCIEFKCPEIAGFICQFWNVSYDDIIDPSCLIHKSVVHDAVEVTDVLFTIYNDEIKSKGFMWRDYVDRSYYTRIHVHEKATIVKSISNFLLKRPCLSSEILDVSSDIKVAAWLQKVAGITTYDIRHYAPHLFKDVLLEANYTEVEWLFHTFAFDRQDVDGLKINRYRGDILQWLYDHNLR